VGKDAVEAKLAKEGKGTRRELHHAAALQNVAQGLVFGIRHTGLFTRYWRTLIIASSVLILLGQVSTQARQSRQK